MNELQAKMLKSLALVVIALAAVGYAYTYSREINRQYPARTFSVDGSAEIDVVPDVAVFSVTVLSEGDKNIANIQKVNSEKMNAITEFAKEQGIKERDLKTLQYNLNPRYGSSICTPAGYCPPATIEGYTLTQSLEIKVRDTEILSNLLSGVVEKGANTVSDVRFVLDDDTEAKNEAREEAIAKAKDKAKAIAKAAGFRLGELITLYESSDIAPMPYYDAMGGGAAMELSAKAAPSIQPGTQPTKVTVTLTYEVKR